MIPIALTNALALYSVILGLLSLMVWLYTEITARRSHQRLEKQNLWHCVFCGYVYLDEGATRLSQCPRCESYNSLDDPQARYVPADHRPPPDEPRNNAGGRNPSRRKRPGQRSRGPRKRR